MHPSWALQQQDICTAQAQGLAALGKRGPFGKTACQTLKTKEVLHPSPISLPSLAGSRKAKRAAGKLE